MTLDTIISQVLLTDFLKGSQGKKEVKASAPIDTQTQSTLFLPSHCCLKILGSVVISTYNSELFHCGSLLIANAELYNWVSVEPDTEYEVCQYFPQM